MSGGRGRGGRGSAILKVLEEMKISPEGMKSEQLQVGRGRSYAMAGITQEKEIEHSKVGRGSLAKILQKIKLQEEEEPNLSKDPIKLSFSTEKKIKPKEEKINYKGTSGKSSSLSSNYFFMKLEPHRGVYQYEVKFQPEIDAMRIRFKIINILYKDYIYTTVFDGQLLYLPNQFDTKVEMINHPITGEPVKVTVIYKDQKSLGECLHLLNVLFKRFMGELKFSRKSGKPHFYDHINTQIIPQHKLEIWPGYITAIDEFEGGVQICCDTSHRVLRTQTVYEIMVEYQFNRRDIQTVILGSSVLTKYNNHMYKIDDIMWDQSPNNIFEKRTGESLKYYRKNYGIEIKDTHQPLLISKQIKKGTPTEKDREFLICLIPELCFLTGITDEIRSDFKIMKDLATFTRTSPEQRVKELEKLVNKINSSPKCKEILSIWGLELQNKPHNLQGRTLEPEKIIVGGKQMILGSQKADWTGSISRHHILSPCKLHSWAIVHTVKDTQFAKKFAQTMYAICPTIGMNIAEGQMITLQNDRIDSYLQALRNCKIPNNQLFVILVQSVREDRYGAIKNYCCIEKPIASQVIVSRTLSKPDRQKAIVQKVAMQINCKIGGGLWSVHIPYENAMICGIDTFHTTSRESVNIGAFVASLNNSYSDWFNFTTKQGSYEFFNSLQIATSQALMKYYERNNRYPDRIICYRDGISDGMFRVCEEHEIPQFEAAFRGVNPEYNPKFTFIICQKRITTRIFLNINGHYENPEPGTILDHTVTRKSLYDFFLVSQNVRQGTVTPTHYVVLHDTGNSKPDHIQRLTYKLTHLYYNWTGTIRIPAPCMYAHKLAFLVGKFLHRSPGEFFNDKLYFL